MKFFKIRNSVGKEIGETYPQLNCLNQDIAFRFNAWSFIEEDIELLFELEQKSKPTDILSDASISGFGLIINEKVKNILLKFNLMNFKLYNAKVKLNGKFEQYFYIHFFDLNLTKQIDYENSKFYETNWTFKENEIVIKSFENYLELKVLDNEAKFGVEINEIFVKEYFDKTLDVFCFLPFHSHLFISEKLKKYLIQNKISGLEFMPAIEIKF